MELFDFLSKIVDHRLQFNLSRDVILYSTPEDNKKWEQWISTIDSNNSFTWTSENPNKIFTLEYGGFIFNIIEL